MRVIGVTGNPASGKSTVLEFFKARGIKVWSADEEVHDLFLDPVIIEKMAKKFPNAVVDQQIDRARLGKMVFSSRAKLKALERFLYPYLREDCEVFLRQMRLAGEAVVVLEVPLLFEASYHLLCDAVVLVDVPNYVRRARLAERGVSREREVSMRQRMMRLEKKRTLADYYVLSSAHTPEFRRSLLAVLEG